MQSKEVKKQRPRATKLEKQYQFDDHASRLDDTKFLLAEPLTTPPRATLIESLSANDLTPYSLTAQDSGPMFELLEGVSDEALRTPVNIDAPPYPVSSMDASSHDDDLANVLSSLHIQATLIESSSANDLTAQDSGHMVELLEGASNEAVRTPVYVDAPPYPASSTESSSHDDLAKDAGSHQQQSGLTFQTSSGNHTTQSGGYGSQSHNVLNPRGHGPSQYSHRGRREPSRGNRHWNVRHAGFNGRNYMHTPPGGLPMPIRPFPPHLLPPFNPWGPELAWSPLWPPGPFPHYMPPPHGNGNFPAVLEYESRLQIVRQVEYYFSYSNLITDEYLRRRMDEQGFVPVRIIAGFHKIKQLTDNIQIVFDALRTSVVLEIQGDKVRSRFNWQRWRIPMDAPGYAVFNE
ncbi:hypothetical protein K1719_019221 [Acacia pycnantha]|nr:hypothetical protein K1719_019221 [Acacia pycnantha]